MEKWFNGTLLFFGSASNLVKMDVQPKHVSVAAGGLALAVCIGQVTKSTPPDVCPLMSFRRHGWSVVVSVGGLKWI